MPEGLWGHPVASWLVSRAGPADFATRSRAKLCFRRNLVSRHVNDYFCDFFKKYLHFGVNHMSHHFPLEVPHRVDHDHPRRIRGILR
jgi:hypothetical protein